MPVIPLSVAEINFERPHLGQQPRDLSQVKTISELPRYLAEVVHAVGEGVQTARQFAELQKISIANASGRFRIARELGWLIRIDNDYHPREGFHYALNPAFKDGQMAE